MNKPKIIAFYLPQYHPVKENSEWFGEGFTEWTNVAKAKPLFKGHDQPRIPKDLGFYDLRLPEVRAKQTELAKRAGIDAFCYYHYWFGNGRVLLEKPLQEVVRMGEPDFPFCLCWANHSWYKKNWNPDVRRIDQALLMEQLYPGDEDIIRHFNFLLPVFSDKRYLRVDDRLLFVVYNIKGIPDFHHFKTLWNKLAKEKGLPEFYFLSYTNSEDEVDKDCYMETDGTILALHSSIDNNKKSSFQSVKSSIKYRLSLLMNKPLKIYSYEKAIKYFITPKCKLDNVVPVIIPNWDYTPRRGVGGLILKDAKPDLFKIHVRDALMSVQGKPQNKQILFVKSWNEWGEGNYMEPDLTYGNGYIEAMRSVVDELY